MNNVTPEQVTASKETPYMLLNGIPATDAEYKRIVNAKAQKAERNRSTAPIESKAYSLLR